MKEGAPRNDMLDRLAAGCQPVDGGGQTDRLVVARDGLVELTKIAPADATIKRYEDNNGTISAVLSGQVDTIATGNVGVLGTAEMGDAVVAELRSGLR